MLSHPRWNWKSWKHATGVMRQPGPQGRLRRLPAHSDARWGRHGQRAVNGLLHGLKRPGRGPGLRPVPGVTPTCSAARWACPPTRWTRPGGSSRRCGRAATGASASAAPVPATPVRAPPRSQPGPLLHLQRRDGPGRRDGAGDRGHARARPDPDPGLYLRTALRQFYRVTDRRHPGSPWNGTANPRSGTCSSALFPTRRPGPTWAAGRSIRARARVSTPGSTSSRSGECGR